MPFHRAPSPILLSLCLGLAALPVSLAQSVQPVISEYTDKADGKFAIVNNTSEPEFVVLEPKSFSIAPDGHGTFRPLDPGIEVELSAMSVRLQPHQTYYVFYKASAETVPAWFTIYSSFTSARHGADISVSIQLPHTVYLYQKKPLEETSIHVADVTYSTSTHQFICDLQNTGTRLGRAHEVLLTGPHSPAVSLAGFPLLPGGSRRIAVDWKGPEPPNSLLLKFDHFTLKPAITLREEPLPLPAPAAAATSAGAANQAAAATLTTPAALPAPATLSGSEK